MSSGNGARIFRVNFTAEATAETVFVCRELHKFEVRLERRRFGLLSILAVSKRRRATAVSPSTLSEHNPAQDFDLGGLVSR
jgi:hypothetical protein